MFSRFSCFRILLNFLFLDQVPIQYDEFCVSSFSQSQINCTALFSYWWWCYQWHPSSRTWHDAINSLDAVPTIIYCWPPNQEMHLFVILIFTIFLQQLPRSFFSVHNEITNISALQHDLYLSPTIITHQSKNVNKNWLQGSLLNICQCSNYSTSFNSLHHNPRKVYLSLDEESLLKNLWFYPLQL